RGKGPPPRHRPWAGPDDRRAEERRRRAPARPERSAIACARSCSSKLRTPARRRLWFRAVPAGEGCRLPDPRRHLLLVELVVLVNVEVAHLILLGRPRGDGTQGSAAEEGHLHVLRE